MEHSTPSNRRRKASSQNDEVILLDDAESTKKVKKEGNAPKHHKKDSIDVSAQEASDRQPAIRSVKREEPEPFPPLPVRPSPSPSTNSAEILELRQHLLMARQESVNNQQQLINASHQLIGTEMEMARKEGIFQNALREAEMRAERAEKLLGSKQGGRDELKEKELEEKVSDLTKELEKEKKQANKKIDKLTKKLGEEETRANEMEEEKNQANKKIDQLTKKLENEETRANEMEKSVTDLSKQLEEQKEDKSRADKKIDQLQRKLGKFVSSSFALARQAVAKDGAERSEPEIHTIAHRFNILLLLSSTANQSISIDEGVEMVRAAFEKCGRKALKRCEEKEWFGDCDVCGIAMPNKLVVTTHFLSKGHIEKVRAHNANVSSRAAHNWAHALEQMEFTAKQKGE